MNRIKKIEFRLKVDPCSIIIRK
jgi:hypothetical protein